MMDEIGGYIEVEKYRLPMMHDDAIALNTGRNCLAYLLQKKRIKSIWIPKFLCASVANVCIREDVKIHYYSIDIEFKPIGIPSTNDWVYIVNYYGQLSNGDLEELRVLYPNMIIDNVQAYFQKPINGSNTIYTCRKFFGVSDGAFLYSDIMEDDLPSDESFERVRHLVGRFEKSASEFYTDYILNEKSFDLMPIRKMSKLTRNILRSIDYEYVQRTREENFGYLFKQFESINKLTLKHPKGPFMYPLLIENGAEVRKQLQVKKIYISTLWPDVFKICDNDELEFEFAMNILPLPVDQRYGKREMEYVASSVFKAIRGEL